MKQKIVIITPAKNEGLHIERLLRNLVLYKLPVIVVNDGSTDKTSLLAKRYTPYVLTHCVNLGKGAALKTGCDFAFEYLKADAVILIDSDGQHSPSEIPQFLEKLAEKRSLVLGVRKSDKEMPIIRQLINRSLSLLLQFIYGIYIPDIPSGFKAFTKKNYSLIQWDGSGYEVETQIAIRIAKQNLSFVTVPIKTIYRTHSKGMTLLEAGSSFINIILSKFIWQKI